MQRHQVSEQEVRAVLDQPETVVSSIKNRQNAIKRIRGRFIRVTFRDDPTRIVVVTVTPRRRPF